MSVSPSLSRRGLLKALAAAGVTAGLTACSTDPDSAVAGSAAVAEAGAADEADVALVLAAIADEEALLNLAVAVQDTHGKLARRVRSLIAIQRRQVQALRGSLTNSDPAANTVTSSVPRSQTAALLSLKSVVTSTGDRRTADCLVAGSGLLAQLLGSIAAAHAVMAEVLGASS